MLWPVLTQFQAMVGKTLLNVFLFWGLKDIGRLSALFSTGTRSALIEDA